MDERIAAELQHTHFEVLWYDEAAQQGLQSFLYGAYMGPVYGPTHKFLHRRWVRR
jgi:hypothetical protein